MALGAYLDIICEVFNNQGIPRLIEMNGDHFRGITEYPKLTHGDVETPDLKDLSAYVKELTGCAALTPDEDLEAYLRKVANLPERLEDQQFDQEMRRQRRQQNRIKQDEDKDKKSAQEGQDIDMDELADDEAEAEAAKKRLGRG